MRRSLTILAMVFTLVSSVALLASSTASAAGWKWTSKGRISGLGGSADAIACPTASMCIIAASDNKIHVTTNPRGKARSAWRAVKLTPESDAVGVYGLSEVECPSATLCVVTDNHQNVHTSTAPTGDADAWVMSRLPSDTYVGVTALSCPTTTLCGAFDISGNALTTVNPGGLGSSWSKAKVNTTQLASLYEISCAGSICVGSQSDSRLYSTPDATKQPAAWRSVKIGKRGKRINTVYCASATLCLAGGSGNALRYSTSPTGGASTWKSIGLAGVTMVDHLYCKSPSLCFALTGSNLQTSRRPTSARSWGTTLRTSGTILADMSCPSSNMCMLINNSGQVWVGTR